VPQILVQPTESSESSDEEAEGHKKGTLKIKKKIATDEDEDSDSKKTSGKTRSKKAPQEEDSDSEEGIPKKSVRNKKKQPRKTPIPKGTKKLFR